MNCASELGASRNHTHQPIYFASDSRYAIDMAEQYAVTRDQTFARNPNPNKPLHLDFASRGNGTWAVSDYYDSFVDLLIMANAKCVVYGEGGFGRFANTLSFDYTCFAPRINREKRRQINCHRKGKPPKDDPTDW